MSASFATNPDIANTTAFTRYGEVASELVLPDAAMLGEQVWATWGYDSKKQKVPNPIPGGKLGSVDKLTAATYAEAHPFVSTAGVEGFALLLTLLSDGKRRIIGVDLDGCRNRETGAIEGWAQEVIARFDSYTEVSPSGTGVKIYALISAADLPAIEDLIGRTKKHRSDSRHARKFTRGDSKNHGPQIEFYASARWFAVTLQHLIGTPIEFRQVDYAAILDLLERMGPAFVAADPTTVVTSAAVGPGSSAPANDDRQERQGLALDRLLLPIEVQERLAKAEARFQSLRKKIDGVFKNEDETGSGAKLSFVCTAKLAGLARDDAKVLTDLHPEWAKSTESEGDRGFDRCWDRAPNPPDPLEALREMGIPPGYEAGLTTLQVSAQAAPQKRTLMTKIPRRELKNRPKRSWHYNRRLPERGIVILSSDPGGFKTFGALALSIPVARGESWAGLPLESGQGEGQVIFFAGEGADDADPRISAYEQYHGYDETDGIDVWIGPFVVDEILDDYRGKKVRLLVIDTLSKWFGALGLDENSTKDASIAMAVLDRIREELGCLIVVLHHLGKDKTKGMRGSTAVLGAADVVIEASSKTTGLVMWTWVKMRSAELPPPLLFEFKKVGDNGLLTLSGAALPMAAGVADGENEKVAIETLEAAIADKANRQGGAFGLPSGWSGPHAHAVTIGEWRQWFTLRYVGSSNAATQAFRRSKKKLTEKGIIYVSGDASSELALVQLAAGV